MVSKTSIIKIVIGCLSFYVCSAEEPTFPYLKEDDGGDAFFNNQYIVQFHKNNAGETTKKRLFNENGTDKDAPRVVRRINSRNISVVTFRSSQAASKWRERSTGIKYFEKGKLLVHS